MNVYRIYNTKTERWCSSSSCWTDNAEKAKTWNSHNKCCETLYQLDKTHVDCVLVEYTLEENYRENIVQQRTKSGEGYHPSQPAYQEYLLELKRITN